jgi:pimeloyl-ACP methyl ester carboxylesterase
VLLLLGDGTRVPVTELPGAGPWTFLVLAPDPDATAPSSGGAARALTRLGRAVVPDLRGRAGWAEGPDGSGFLHLVDDLDQVRTRAGLGRPVLVGLGRLAPVALRAAADQPWAWRALVVAPPPSDPVGPSPPDPSGPSPAGPSPSDPTPVGVDHPDLAAPGAGPAAEPGVAGLDLPVLVLDAEPASDAGVAAVERLLERLGGGPGWAGIAPDAPPR